MSIVMKGPDGNIFTIATAINCKEYRTEVWDDGFIKHIECASRTVKPECKTCGLTNAVKPQHRGLDPKD
jgi:hypothetical protein